MYVIGLTGGIGSGKSTVSAAFGRRGAVVIDVDAIGRRVLEVGERAHAPVIARFGDTIVAPDGSIDRAALAPIVFGDPDELAALEAISHPAINADLDEQLARLPDDAIVVLDMAVLVESELGKLESGRGYELVVVVETPDDVRLPRLVERGMTEADARARMASQASTAERRAVADLLVDNGGDLAALEHHVDAAWLTIERNAERKALLTLTATGARRYLDALDGRSVAPSAAAVAALAGLDGTLPDGPVAPSAVVADLTDTVAAATTASAGGRYFGFVNGATHPAALAASWLTSAWDQNVALAAMSPGAAHLDAVALRWVVELLGLPGSTGGAFVSGATMANTAALVTARDTQLAAAGWNSIADGLLGAPNVEVFVGGEAHSTVHKALGLVGLGRDRVRRLPADAQGRVVAHDLPSIAGPTIVCLQAGNVNSGAFDPFVELIEWAHDAGAWVHVDGAFGLWAAACPERAHLTAGVATADSWATDAHKWLNATYDSGIVLVSDPEALRRSMDVSAAYLPAGESRDPMRYSPQSSQRARGVETWAVLASLGRQGVADLVSRCCGHARVLAAGLADAGYEVLNEVVLNQVVVSFGDDQRTRDVIEAVQADGTCWCGGTSWQGRQAMRISVSSWATTDNDVDRSLAAIVRCAEQVR